MTKKRDTPNASPSPGYDTPSGEAPVRETARAEILKPGKDGYQLAGYGGNTKFPKPASKPVFKAPSKEARARMPSAVSPARQSEALAETVMSSILDRLTAEAHRKGGMLSIDDLTALDQEFKKKTQALQQVFQASFDEYVKAREQTVRDNTRDFPFGRMLVEQFAGSFAGDDEAGNAVSRRILPGFFIASNMMLGPEFVEGAQQLCRGIVDRHKTRKGQAFEWADFYSDPDARDILADALMAIAPYFEQADRRMSWMIDIINSHLEPAKAAGGEHWVLDERGLRDVLERMFQFLRDTLANPASRSALAQRHGDDVVDDVSTTLTRLLGL